MFPPEGNQLVSVGSQGQAILWDVVKYERLRKWSMPVKPMVCSVALTFDGRYLATGTSEGSVVVYRLDFKKAGEESGPSSQVVGDE